MYDILVDYLKEVLPADVSADMVGIILLVAVFAILVASIGIIIWQLVKLCREQKGGEEKSAGSKREEQIRETISEDPLPVKPLPQQKAGVIEPQEEQQPPHISGVTVMGESDDDAQGNEAGYKVYAKPGTLPGLVLLILLPDGRVNRCCLQPEVLKTLPGQVVLIGRSKEAQVQFRDKTVSNRHLHLGADDHGYWVEDVGSSNGTLLNGSACVAHRRYSLQSGDSLRLGNSALKIQLDVPPAGMIC